MTPTFYGVKITLVTEVQKVTPIEIGVIFTPLSQE